MHRTSAWRELARLITLSMNIRPSIVLARETGDFARKWRRPAGVEPADGERASRRVPWTLPGAARAKEILTQTDAHDSVDS
jgi:hypothetical protein